MEPQSLQSHGRATPSWPPRLQSCLKLNERSATVGLDGVSGAPKGDTVLGPLDEILGVEIGVECFGEDVEVDIVVVQHIEQRELP